jgi:hypothetical protein
VSRRFPFEVVATRLRFAGVDVGPTNAPNRPLLPSHGKPGRLWKDQWYSQSSPPTFPGRRKIFRWKRRKRSKEGGSRELWAEEWDVFPKEGMSSGKD